MKHAGFTIIEVVIALAIMAILFGLTASSLTGSYASYQFQSERDLALALIRKARSQALTGTNSKDHGVKVASASFIAFDGASYATRDSSKDIVLPRISTVSITGASEVVFAYLTGRSSTTTLVLSEGANTASISINQEGLISW